MPLAFFEHRDFRLLRPRRGLRPRDVLRCGISREAQVGHRLVNQGERRLRISRLLVGSGRC
jgi:ABC-type phosphonate transport system ATPase subunit